MTYENPEIFVVDALIASMVVDPHLPGLSFNELKNLGAQHNLLAGEIGDKSKKYGVFRHTPDRIDFDVSQLNDCQYGIWEVNYQPEFRDLNAIKFIIEFFYNQSRSEGQANLGVPRNMLIARAVQQGIEEHDVDVAISLMLLSNAVKEIDGLIKPVGVPTKQDFSRRENLLYYRCTVKQLLPEVRDLIARRSDGRLPAAEPIDAMESIIAKMGHPKMVIWWRHMALELRSCDPNKMPAVVTVFSAALAEAALSLVVQHAQTNSLSMRNMPTAPTRWKFHELVKDAKSGTAQIIDEPLAQRCLTLNDDRQRIHAGRHIDSASPYPHVDFRYEQARDALATLDTLLRKVLDWYLANPVERNQAAS